MGVESLCSWSKAQTVTATSLPTYNSPVFASRPAHFRSLSLFLSSSTITSTLGSKLGPRSLYFTCFLSEDPLIGIFCGAQDFHIPVSRRRKLAHQRYSDGNAIRRLLARLMPWCNASIVVETQLGRWEYKVPARAMKWCSWRHGVLLLDWQALYVDCFEQDQRRRKKEERRRREYESAKMEGKLHGGQRGGYMEL